MSKYTHTHTYRYTVIHTHTHMHTVMHTHKWKCEWRVEREQIGDCAGAWGRWAVGAGGRGRGYVLYAMLMRALIARCSQVVVYFVLLLLLLLFSLLLLLLLIEWVRHISGTWTDDGKVRGRRRRLGGVKGSKTSAKHKNHNNNNNNERKVREQTATATTTTASQWKKTSEGKEKRRRDTPQKLLEGA